MKTTESNKLIAEFMPNMMDGANSLYDPDIEQWLDDDGEYYIDEELRYHTSWDWLMPVVEKIEDIYCEETSTETVGYHLYDVEIRQNVTIIHGTDIEETVGDKLFNTYNAVVEFIKWYNEIKLLKQ